jgi:hypothetical protein
MPRGGSVTVHCCVAQAELLKLQSESALEVYYESMKRNLKIKPIHECRCNGRLQTKRLSTRFIMNRENES